MNAPFRLPPSSAHRWTNCALFLQAAQRYPEPPEGDEAREGTCAAWVAQLALTGQIVNCAAAVGANHANGWLVTAEMARDVQGYVDTILKRGGTTSCESYVTLTTDPFIAGTLDLAATVGNRATLYIDDLKYGRKIVEARGNPQLLIYAAATLRNYAPGTFNFVSLGIYQPRAFHRLGIYRTAVVEAAIVQKLADEIIAAGRRCYEPDPVGNAGEWCEHCPVANRCETLAHTNYGRVTHVASKHHRDMTVIELSRELDFLEEAEATLKARKKAVEAEAEQRARVERIPGRTLEMGKGKKKFRTDGEVLRMMTGISPYEKPTVCTPAELVRRGASKTVVDAHSFTPDTGFKLTKVDIAAAFGE